MLCEARTENKQLEYRSRIVYIFAVTIIWRTSALEDPRFVSFVSLRRLVTKRESHAPLTMAEAPALSHCSKVLDPALKGVDKSITKVRVLMTIPTEHIGSFRPLELIGAGNALGDDEGSVGIALLEAAD